MSGTVGAIEGANAQNNATNANKKNVQQTNALNRQMFQESRGSGGSAVLPLYLKTRDGGLFEGQLGQNLEDAYNNSRPDQGAIDSAVSRQAPTESAAQDVGASVFNGGMQGRLESNFQPVKEARVTFARQNAMDALKKTLADIQDTQAGRGFTGDSMANDQMKFEANKTAADSVAGANLQNLTDEQNIKNQVLQYQLGNLALPNTMAAQGADYTNLANQKFIEAVQQGLLPLNFMRLGTAQPFQYQGFHQDAVPSAAQMALSGISQTGSSVLDSWLKSRAQAPSNVNTNSVVPTATATLGAMPAAVGTGTAAGATWAGGDMGAGAAAGSAGAADAAALA